MVDEGETPRETAVREFVEEAIDDQHIENIYSNRLLSRGEIVYEGYVDDPRNTDNAWMETTAINYHIESENEVTNWHFNKVSKWMEANSFINLYASHKSLMYLVCKLHKADW